MTTPAPHHSVFTGWMLFLMPRKSIRPLSMVSKSFPTSFGKSASLRQCQKMHFPTVCASCTMHNVTKLLWNVTEALRSIAWRYRSVTEPLQSIMEHYRSVTALWSIMKRYRTVWDLYGAIVKHCEALCSIMEQLRNVTEALHIITGCYRMLRDHYWTLMESYGTVTEHRFCSLLIKFQFCSSLKCQHACATLYYTVGFPPKKQKKFAPSLTNPQSSRWNNGKMKISCSSAYVQTETLNFTFARQAILCICLFVPTAHVAIFAMTTQCYNLTSRNSLLLQQSQNSGNGICVFHTHLLCDSNKAWWWWWWYNLKANEKTFPMIYCPYGNIVNFSNTSLIHFSCTILSFKFIGEKLPETSRNYHFLLQHVDSHLMYQCLGRPLSLPQTTARLVHALPHNCATTSPLVTMGRPKFTPKTATSPLMITTPI